MSRNWFIALPVPAARWFDRVTGAPPGVRVFHPDDLHITIAFLGPVEQQAAESAFAEAPRWPAGPLEATLERIAALGNPRRPHALAAHVGDGADSLNRAIAAVRRDMCERAGATPDDRPPLAHVTLARVGRSARNAERKRALAWARDIELGSPRLRLSRLVLYRGCDDPGERLFRQYAAYDVETGSIAGAGQEPESSRRTSR